MNKEIKIFAAEIIQRNFDLEETSSSENQFQQMRSMLIEKIDFLLNHNFEKLLSILYRIDVNEKKATLALSQSEKPSAALADLIIERQMEKAKTRLQFKSEEGDL